MTNNQFILLLLFFCIACQNKKAQESQQENMERNIHHDSLKKYIYFDTLLIQDSTSIVLKNDKEFIIKTPSLEKRVHLDSFKIPTKIPAELIWSNEHFVCIVTYWCMHQSFHIFLPINPRNKIAYFDKKVNFVDRIHHNVVYIDSLEETFIQYKVLNLFSHKFKKVSLGLNSKDWEQDAPPIRPKEFKLTKDSFIVSTSKEKKEICIKKIYTDT